MEDEDLVAMRLEPLASRLHAGRGDAIHRGRHDRSSRQRGAEAGRGVGHARDGSGGVGEDPLRELVEPSDVHHRVHERDVGCADVRARIPRGHRRDQHLGHTDGQRLHGRGRDRRASRPADRGDAVEAAFRVESAHDLGRAASHGHHRRSAVSRSRQRSSSLACCCRHVISRDVCDRAVCDPAAAADAGVDEDDLAAVLDDPVAQVAHLGTLGVECPEQHHDRPDVCRHVIVPPWLARVVPSLPHGPCMPSWSAGSCCGGRLVRRRTSRWGARATACSAAAPARPAPARAPTPAGSFADALHA